MTKLQIEANSRFVSARWDYLSANGWVFVETVAANAATRWWKAPDHLVKDMQKEFREDEAARLQESWDNDQLKEKE